MKRMNLFTAILLVALLTVGGPSAAYADWNWLEQSRQLKEQLMVSVQQNWSKVKVWLAKSPAQEAPPARMPASTPPVAAAPAAPVVVEPAKVTVINDPEQARIPHEAVATPVAAPAVDPLVKAKVEQIAPPVQVTAGTTPLELTKIKTQAQAQKGFVVVDQGRKAAPQLKKDKAGVVRSEPTVQGAPAVTRLDVGQEPRLSADQFKLDKVQFGTVNKQTFKKLESPAVIAPQTTAQAIQKIVGKGVVAAGGAKKLKETEALQNKMINIAKVQGMKFKIASLKDITEKPYQALSQSDLNILTALVLVERGDQCHVASGLLYDLRNEKSVEAEANYYLAECASKMGLPSQYVSSLLKVLATEDAELVPKALEHLSIDVGYEHEVKVGLALQKLQNRKLVPANARAKVDYLIAKANVRTGNYQTALVAAQAIPKDFAKYPEAQYILATSQYATGQAKAALQTQEKLVEMLDSSGQNPELKVLTQLNLGRIAFQDKQFEKAKEYFLKIDKNHPLWIEALIEQGWAQLQSGDIGGAIGNMYSVQSPFFRGVFLPESYVIRSIGYLSLCQYGDAYKSLSMLEHNYRPWLAQIEKYSAGKKNLDLYETVRKYLKSPSSTDVDGLPYQLIREVARQRDFLNHQQVINAQEDEIAQYKFLEGLLVKDKATVTQKLSQLNGRMMELQKSFAESRNRHEPKDVQDRWVSLIKGVKSDLEFYRFRLDIQLDSRKAFGEMREKNLEGLASAKAQMRSKANSILVGHFNAARKELNDMMDNNELLRYEVFAGSGENIRYQAAGGDVHRVPATAKPTSKNLQWEFDGEYWADEIGNYRSTLENNCPDSHKGSTPRVAGGE